MRCVGGALLQMLKYFEVKVKILNPPSCNNLQNRDWFMQISFHELTCCIT